MKEDLPPNISLKRICEYLSPEEREKTLEVAREVVAEAKKLLGDQYSIDRVVPKDAKCLEMLRNQPEGAITPLDSELTITTLQYKKVGGDAQCEFHIYALYPDYVIHSISNMKTQDGRIKDKTEISREANTEDLTTLLQDIRDSQPRKE